MIKDTPMETKPERIPLQVQQPPPPSGPSSVQSSEQEKEMSDLPESGPVEPAVLKEKIIEALQTCFDPEIPVNIHELGLIYDIAIDPSGQVEIRMTLTSPACPAALTLPPEVQAKVSKVWGVKNAHVEVVWDPPWTQDRMSEAARLQLGLF